MKHTEVEVIRCAHCHRLGLAIDCERVTSHKCAGAWTTVAKLELTPREVSAMADKLRAAATAGGKDDG